MRPLSTTLVAAALGSGCGSAGSREASPTTVESAPRHAPHGHAHGSGAGAPHHAFTNADAWTKVFDDPARDEWQRPDDVLAALKLEPTMTVADVGAGTGYFSVRLARRVPAGAVIATDVEPDMVRFLGERARREGIGNLRPLLAPHGASGLPAESVDRILVVHVWHHLDDRAAYARSLAAALRPGGRLAIVDFELAARRGPPADLRVAPEEIVGTLESAGLSARVSPLALPDQYLVEGRERP